MLLIWVQVVEGVGVKFSRCSYHYFKEIYHFFWFISISLFNIMYTKRCVVFICIWVLSLHLYFFFDTAYCGLCLHNFLFLSMSVNTFIFWLLMLSSSEHTFFCCFSFLAVRSLNYEPFYLNQSLSSVSSFSIPILSKSWYTSLTSKLCVFLASWYI